MSHTTDPRASMSAYHQTSVSQQCFPAQYARFYEGQPSVESDSIKIWFARGQNFLIGQAEGADGGTIERSNQIDEYVVLSVDPAVGFEVQWNGVNQAIPGASIAFVPAGSSAIRLKGKGAITLMFTTRNLDLVELCSNSKDYAVLNEHVPPFKPWPEAAGEQKIRFYSLDVPDTPGRFGRIWRCSTFMVNVLPPQIGPRDVTKLSPHHHNDFEQGSLALAGVYTHHIRWPWSADLTKWRNDDHESCGSPSIAVIPPPAIHTSQAMDDGVNQLVDIFSPPRFDFSQKEGWVLNADEYPMPAVIGS